MCGANITASEQEEEEESEEEEEEEATAEEGEMQPQRQDSGEGGRAVGQAQRIKWSGPRWGGGGRMAGGLEVTMQPWRQLHNKYCNHVAVASHHLWVA